MILRGERVVLRPVAQADVGSLAEILQEPEVARWWHGYDAARVQAELVDPGDCEPFAIEVDGRVAGLLLVTEELEPDYRHAALDLFLATSDQGRGLGTETLGVAARHLFDERGADGTWHDALLMDLLAADFER